MLVQTLDPKVQINPAFVSSVKQRSTDSISRPENISWRIDRLRRALIEKDEYDVRYYKAELGITNSRDLEEKLKVLLIKYVKAEDQWIKDNVVTEIYEVTMNNKQTFDVPLSAFNKETI